MTTMPDYCLGTLASGHEGWLWVEAKLPWGGLYEPGGDHNSRKFWFHQSPEPMGTTLVYWDGQWVLGNTHLVTSSGTVPISSVSHTIPLHPMIWPRIMNDSGPNGHESANSTQRVWDFSFFKRYRTVVSAACQTYCAANAACTTHLQNACKGMGSEGGQIDFTGSDVCECFRPADFYEAIADKLKREHPSIPLDTIDRRPSCLWGPCSRSSIPWHSREQSCPPTYICDASASLNVEHGSVILAAAVSVNASCVFNDDESAIRIENENEDKNMDGLVTGTGGNSKEYFKDEYGFDIKNPLVVLVCGMAALSVVLAVSM